MIKLGRFEYPSPVVVLAPMAGISDLPFRRICQNLGSHYTVAEMVSAKPELLSTKESQLRLLFDEKSDAPKIVQLVGNDPQVMADSAVLMAKNGADVIDINMGCPAKKVGKSNAGSALLGDLKQVEAILNKVCSTVDIPVTLKTRIGFSDDQINILEVANIAKNAGIQVLTVHGRTRAQKFKGSARYDEIAEAKNKVDIPVIVNGDIVTLAQVQTLVNDYQFDGVMLGRGVQGNPWLLNQIRCFLEEDFPLIEQKPYQLVKDHLLELYELYGKQGVLVARKHLHWYVKTLHLPTGVKSKINRAKTSKEQLTILDAFPKTITR